MDVPRSGGEKWGKGTFLGSFWLGLSVIAGKGVEVSHLEVLVETVTGYLGQESLL